MHLDGGVIMSDNKMSIEFVSKSENEAFARVAVAAFVCSIRSNN